MPLTPEQLAAELKRSIEKAEDAAGVPRGAIAYAWAQERAIDGTEDKPYSQWIEAEAARIKAEQHRKERVFSPSGLRSLFVGLK